MIYQSLRGGTGMTYEQITSLETFTREVWCKGLARTIFLMDKGFTESEIHDLFEQGVWLQTIKEHAQKMTPEQRFSFWSVNC